MAVKAKYTQQIQVVAAPEMREALYRVANEDEVSVAQVIRDCIDLGLPLLLERREAR